MLNSNKLLIVYETRNAQVTFAENGCLIHTWLELLMVQLWIGHATLSMGLLETPFTVPLMGVAKWIICLI